MRACICGKRCVTARSLRTFPVHLGLGARAKPQPEFTGAMAWYEDYGARNAGDEAEARLVALHDFTESWESWEMHPEGDEVVVCMSDSITLVQEMPDKSETRITLGAGDYAINPAGI
jgi:hypothetical protein